MKALGTLALIAALFAGCGDVATPGGSETWPRNLANTTCADWSASMTPGQRASVAAELLDLSRSNTLPDAPAASSSLVSAFGTGIDGACREQGAAYPIIGAGVLVYIGDKKYEP